MLVVMFWICVSLTVVSAQAQVDDQENNIKAILNLLSNGGPDFGINQEIPSDDIVNPPEDNGDFGTAYDLPLSSSKANSPMNNIMKRIYIVFQKRCEKYGSCMANKGRRRYQKCECPGDTSCQLYDSEYFCF